jgi:hypothetical protein
MGVTYDYESIMQYGPYDFAIDPSQPTMSGIQGIVGEQSKILGDGDIALIRQFYNCVG